MGLVLSRKIGEKIFIGDDIVITPVRMERGKVQLDITAPQSMAVDREEVRRRKWSCKSVEVGGEG